MSSIGFLGTAQVALLGFVFELTAISSSTEVGDGNQQHNAYKTFALGLTLLKLIAA